MESSVNIGKIKKCPSCGDENYIRSGVKSCPNCGKDFSEYIEKKSPDVIVFLGTPEINRRTVVQLRNMNLIDDFRV